MRFRLLIVLSCLLFFINALAGNTTTIDVTFKDFPKGSSYAENEKHDLGNGLVIYTTQCHFTEQLRIYSSQSYNGFVVSDPLPGSIDKMTFSAAYASGYTKDVLNIYGSADKKTWTLIGGIEVSSTSYKNHTLTFPKGENYTCFKLDVAGDQQIRIESMSITYTSGNEDEDDDEENIVTVSAPIFKPSTSTFSSESLDVAISAAEGCDIYYTTDGTTPTLENLEKCSTGNIATIYASTSPIVLNAIAVNPVSGECSNVSRATYTYVAPAIENDGSKEKPFTVAEVKQMVADKRNRWVKGIIYGVVVNEDISDVVTSGFNSSTNIVIGNELIHIPIRLTDEGSETLRKDLNLVDHSYLIGKEILVKGLLTKCYDSFGVAEVTDYEITYDVPINSYGYATLFLDMPVSVPSGSTAYYCTVGGDYAKLHSVGTLIPAEVGVILESSPNTTCTLSYSAIGSNEYEENIRNSNLLIGCTKEQVITNSEYTFYALNVKDNKLGFYVPQTMTDSRFTAKANKAYLQVPNENKAPMFILRREANETEIVHISHTTDETIYDLWGRIISTPSSGVYVKGGKKVVIR